LLSITAILETPRQTVWQGLYAEFESWSLDRWCRDVGRGNCMHYHFYYKIYSTRPRGVLKRVSSGDTRNAADWHHIHRNSRHQWHLGKRNGGLSIRRISFLSFLL